MSSLHVGHCTFFLSGLGFMKQPPHFSCMGRQVSHSLENTHTHTHTHTHTLYRDIHWHTSGTLSPSAGLALSACPVPGHKGQASTHGSEGETVFIITTKRYVGGEGGGGGGGGGGVGKGGGGGGGGGGGSVPCVQSVPGRGPGHHLCCSCQADYTEGS